ncbi:metallophosphoesterase [Streptococcus sobrinus]|uniref:metallophosphoesterase n=1 Tax=Streptococcus sobrinus TaxID=1310 RepID=UPI0002E93547|nr:metallophosphoesterase [Streptococcus sobrinus]OZV23989.1 phosphoesterase [Streptococcus sobrinus]
MTKLAIISDLHIDLNQFSDFEKETLLTILQETGVTHLHLAGDISNHHKDISLPFIEELRKSLEVTYNLGNHDMLDLNDSEINQLDFQVYNLGSRQLLAFHGWYDYSFSREPTDKILRLKKIFWFDRRLNRQESDPAITQKVLARLEDLLQHLDTSRLIVAMHFVPHQDFTMTHPKFAPFNAFLGSQKFHQIFVNYGVRDVVFGHAHRSYGDQTIEGVTYHSHPLGYIREWDLTIDFVSNHPELNPSGTWNLSKRYNLVRKNPDYQAYKKEQFQTELLKSMTIFGC